MRSRHPCIPAVFRRSDEKAGPFVSKLTKPSARFGTLARQAESSNLLLENGLRNGHRDMGRLGTIDALFYPRVVWSQQ